MTTQNIANKPTHIAYADETHHNIGRYRGIALVTLKQDCNNDLSTELRKLLKESSVTEFKWEKLRMARERFAAQKILKCIVEKIIEKSVRIDVLVWDIKDSRHNIKGRDDTANLQRMYYHLFKNVLCERWPVETIWVLYPDEHTAMEWDKIGNFIDIASTKSKIQQSLFTQGRFNISQIRPVKSCLEPIVQVADLFAGLAVYSRDSYDCYKYWQCISSKQQTLFETTQRLNIKLSNSDKNRCEVLNEFDLLCKKYSLGVSLETNRGLRTFGPKNQINFWWYDPQHKLDKAPTKNRK